MLAVTVDALSPESLLSARSACLSERDTEIVNARMEQLNKALIEDWTRSSIGLKVLDVSDAQIGEIVRRFESAEPVPWTVALLPMDSGMRDNDGSVINKPNCYVLALRPAWNNQRGQK